jgi:PII-like signaling protein
VAKDVLPVIQKAKATGATLLRQISGFKSE